MKKNKTVLWSLMCAVIVLATASQPCGAEGPEGVPANEWLIGTVDSTREVGYDVSVATDPITGDMYISYYEGDDGDLWLARTGAPSGNCGPGNQWDCQVVATSGVVGKYSSIAVSGTGTIAAVWISYYDETFGHLKIAKWRIDRVTGALVTAESYTVDPGDLGGTGIRKGTRTSVTINASGNPEIAYQVTFTSDTRSVKHAYPVAPGTGNCGYGAGLDSWQCEGVHIADGIGDEVDIDVGPGGVTYIAFSVKNSGGGWLHPTIATDVGSGGSCSSGTFQCAPIEHFGANTGEYLAFEVAVGGVKHLAYRNETTDSLEWARYVGPGLGNCGPGDDSYQCEWIDDIGFETVPAGIDMKIDDNGQPIIVYQDQESGSEDLKIARPLSATPWGPVPNCGPDSGIMYEWFCETLEEGTIASSYARGGLSIDLNAKDEAAVAYRELFWDTVTERGRLKIATEPISIFLDGFEIGNSSRWSATVP